MEHLVITVIFQLSEITAELYIGVW